MRWLFRALVVWLMGLSAAPAGAAETWHYRVYWGPWSMGHATVVFNPQPRDYSIEAHVKGSLPFFAIDDTWTAEGTVKGGQWRPRSYHVLQAENDYRADKVVEFDYKTHKVTYRNLRGGEADIVMPLESGLQDPLSALFALRASGDLGRDFSRPVIALKRPFTLQGTVRETGKAARRLDLTPVETDGRQGKSSWQMLLREDADLVPAQITMHMKLGTFRAVLEEEKE
jgi:hypothetical protein